MNKRTNKIPNYEKIFIVPRLNGRTCSILLCVQKS